MVENYTYSDVFWRNFFRTAKANQYLIPPSSIIKQETHIEPFESNNYKGAVTYQKKHDGNFSIVLNKEDPFTRIFQFSYPKIFDKNYINKVRFSFWAYCSPDIKSMHIYLKFYDKDHQQLFEMPFYIDQHRIRPNTWDYNEFGYQLSDVDFEGKTPIHSIELFIWDNENKNEIYIDDVKTEFIVTDKSFEILQ